MLYENILRLTASVGHFRLKTAAGSFLTNQHIPFLIGSGNAFFWQIQIQGNNKGNVER